MEINTLQSFLSLTGRDDVLRSFASMLVKQVSIIETILTQGSPVVKELLAQGRELFHTHYVQNYQRTIQMSNRFTSVYYEAGTAKHDKLQIIVFLLERTLCFADWRTISNFANTARIRCSCGRKPKTVAENDFVIAYEEDSENNHQISPRLFSLLPQVSRLRNFQLNKYSLSQIVVFASPF